MRQIFRMSALVAGTVVGVAALGGSLGSKTTCCLNVTTLVHDASSDGTELLMRSDDYNGSGEATYDGSGNGQSLTSIIANGELDLGLLKQSVRTLFITPNDPVGSQPPGQPAGYYSQGVDLLSGCFDASGNTVPLENVLISSGNCKLMVNFDSEGNLYKLLMSPFPFRAGEGTPICPLTGCPSTGFVTIMCNKVSSNECVSWTIVPNATAPNANVANLYRYQPQGRTQTWVFIGQYYNTFRIDVTNP